MSISSLHIRLALIPVVIFAVSIVLAEITFRFLGVAPIDTFAGPYESLGENNFKLRPNVETSITQFPSFFELYTDAIGFRKSKHDRGLSADDTDIDILIVGDSQAFGWGLPYEDSLPGLFQSAAEEKGLKVANAAIGAHFIRNQVDLVKHLVDERGLRPNTILVSLTSRAIQAGYMKVDVQDNGLIFWFEPTGMTLLKTWIARHSAVYLVIRNTYYNLRGSYQSFFEPSTGLDAAQKVPLEVPLDEELTSTLRELTNISEVHGTKVVICYFPFVRPSDLAAGVLAYDKSAQKLQASAKALDAPFIDLTPALIRIHELGEPLTMENDGHYGPAASREVARAMWESIDWYELVNAKRVEAEF